MKTKLNIILSTFFTLLFLIACEQVSCGCDPFVPDYFSGKWKLEKITFGYPPPNAPTFTTQVENEMYIFKANKNYEFIKKEDKIETGTYSLNFEGSDFLSGTIKFLEEKEYSTFTFTDNRTVLSLYQRSPSGAVLADGNTFVYRKQP
jgi:hypothetical protein